MNYRPMKIMRKLLLPILTISLLTSCDFIKNALTYKDKTEELVEMLLTEDYEKAVDLFAMEHDMAKNTDVAVLKKGLADFRKRIVDNFGTELDYSFMKAEKKISTTEEDNTPPNTTVALVEFSNGKEFGVFKVLFDDNSGKILNLNTLDVKEPIPSMTIFWLFGLLAICVPIFNIFVIREIKRSDLRKKWLKYVAVIFLNVPAITYAAVGGLSFKLLNFQILLGISFGYMGFLNSYWSLGIPLGGLYWFWKLRTKKIEIQHASISVDQDIETKPTAE
jgi:nitrate reductase NapE component